MNHPLSSSRDSLSGRPVPEVLAEIAAAIREARSFVLTSHAGPDGDALGSAVALALGLRALGKSVRAVTAHDIPARYEALLPPGVIENVQPADLAKANQEVDWFIVLDTSEPERIGGYREQFFAEGARRICIDHHRTHARDRYQHELVVAEAPATGSLVFALLDELDVELTPEIARALWLAIATDTGWFRFSNTGPWALLDAARLARVQVDVEAIYDRVYHDLSPTRARLVGHVLQRARIIALIVELEPGSFKVSLRARGDAEVESVARSFGGGGHAKAAGCRFTGRLEDLIDQLRSRARSELARRGPAGAGNG